MKKSIMTKSTRSIPLTETMQKRSPDTLTVQQMGKPV